jgi:hypothetical protein
LTPTRPVPGVPITIQKHDMRELREAQNEIAVVTRSVTGSCTPGP